MRSEPCFGGFGCHVSVSNIKHAEQCMFLWYTEKIQRQADEGEKSRGLQIGEAGHEELEQAGLPEDLSRLARVAWDLVPGGPNAGYLKESYIDHVDLGLPWPFYGKMDLYHPEKRWIWDYKFSSNRGFKEFLPDTKEKIAKDFQLNLYAAADREMYGDLPAAVGHMQVNYDTGRGRFVWTEPDPDEVEKALKKAKKIAEDMRRFSRVAARDVPTNGAPGKGPECNAYGRPCVATRYCMELQNHWHLGVRRQKRKTGWEI
jgi:hypothetical protein